MKRLLCLLLAAAATALAFTATASAGQWVQVSCVNPDGSASSNQGWTATASTNPTPPYGSTTDDNCGPGSPMAANLSASAQAANAGPAVGQLGAFTGLTWEPPAGSTLAGGTLLVSGYGGGGGNATAASWVESPLNQDDSSDVLYQCVRAFTTCGPNASYDYATTVTLPANRGGGIYLQDVCQGDPGTTCSQYAENGVWASIALSSAQLLLSNSSIPAASGFTGTALENDSYGATNLLFTASDPNGPGVYNVTVSVDGSAVYSATPNNQSGQCVSHGTYAGTSALEFDYAQPCPQQEAVDVPVNVGGLKNGKHELTAAVTDAAGNSATVLDQTIVVDNPVTTNSTVPAPKKTKHRSIRVKVGVSSVWRGSRTKVAKLTFKTLPRGASVALSCSGRGCPKNLGKTSRKLLLKTLEKRLYSDTFASGDKLQIQIAHAGELAERIRVTVRNGEKPELKLL